MLRRTSPLLLWASMLTLLSFAAMACSSGDGDGGGGEPLVDVDVLVGVETNMQLTSSGFGDGGDIPGAHSCYGIGTSPPLSWSGVPEGTQSLALIVEDPAGDDPVHWVVYDLPPDVTGLPGSISITQETVLGGKQGRNDYNRRGWEGPCPDRGGEGEAFYVFDLYALDTVLGIDVEGGARRNDVFRAMNGRVIGHGRLMGKYCQSDKSTVTLTRGRGTCPPFDSKLGE